MATANKEKTRTEEDWDRNDASASISNATFRWRNSDISAKIGPEKRVALRKKTKTDLVYWHQKVFPNSTGLKPFGQVQIASIAQSYSVITQGGRTGKFEPRGFGKSTRAVNEALFAVLHGYRKFVVIFASSVDKAEDSFKGIRNGLVDNEIIAEMFPIVSAAMRDMDGAPIKSAKQHINGKPTRAILTAEKIVLPWVPGKPWSGAVIMVRPINNARGLVHSAPDGSFVRPDLLLIDDPQTDETAVSPASIKKLLKTMKASLSFLGSHSKRLAMILSATIIEPNDACDELSKDPAWMASRYKMLRSLPTNQELWDRYTEIIRDCDRTIPESVRTARLQASLFYLENRVAMDDGADPTWDWADHWNDPDSHEHGPIQHAMNILADDPVSFWSECQNDPMAASEDEEFLTVKAIQEKQHGSKRGEIPLECEKLCCYVDVQKKYLFSCSIGFAEGFSGYFFDWGTFPDQERDYFMRDQPFHEFSDLYPKISTDDKVYKAVEEYITQLLNAVFFRQSDGVRMQYAKIGLDSRNWTSTIRKCYRDHPGWHSRVQLCMGEGIGARKKPMALRKTEVGAKRGPHWYITPVKEGVRTMMIDTNFWKSFVHYRLATDYTAKGSLSLFNTTPQKLLLIAEHLKAEFRTPVVGPYGRVDEWGELPGRDNEALDGFGGCHALASLEGIKNTSSNEHFSGRKKLDLSKWKRG